MIRIGCSGWNYRHWRGRFYSESLPVKRWFSFYTEHFDTVEINNSFYRLPKPATVDGWRKQAPDGFSYAVKANRYLTQAKNLRDCEEPMARMMASFSHFGSTLGPILYQLPPHLSVDHERLAKFLQIMPKGTKPIFEFRHPSWYRDDIFTLLERHDAGLCVHDMAGSVSPRLALGQTAYVRFHGSEGKYWGRYPKPTLIEWAEWMQEQAHNGRTVWVYFNNDPEAQAINDALSLKTIIGQ